MDDDDLACVGCGDHATGGCIIPDLALGPQIYCKDCCPRCSLFTEATAEKEIPANAMRSNPADPYFPFTPNGFEAHTIRRWRQRVRDGHQAAEGIDG